MITLTVFLMLIFAVKHFLADFVFQTRYMLGKFKPGTEAFAPLAAHCGVHAAFTFIIAGLATKNWEIAFNLTVLDFTVHFIMDRIKASPDMLGKFQALSKNEMMAVLSMERSGEKSLIEGARQMLDSNKKFWLSLGVDQMVHNFTDILIVYVIAHTMTYGL